MKIENASIMERLVPNTLTELRKYHRPYSGRVEFASSDFGVDQEEAEKLKDTLSILQQDHNDLVNEIKNNEEDSWNPARKTLIKELGEYCQRLSEMVKPENVASNPLPKETREYELDEHGLPTIPKLHSRKATNRDDPLTREQRMEDWHKQFHGKGEHTDFSTGDYVRAWITGEHTEQTRRAMVTTGSGGVLIPSILPTRIIDLARNKTRVIQAGAMTWPMESKTLTVPRQVGDASAGWRPELGHIHRTDVSFEPLVLKACSMGALITLSYELLEDAVGLDAFLTRTLSAVMAAGIDQAALSGEGEMENEERIEPIGVLNTDNVQAISLNADLKTYTPFSSAITKVRQVNGEPSGLMMAPVNFGILDALTATDGQPLMPPPSWSQVSHYDTNQLDEHTAIIGDWSQLAIGIRHNLRLEYATAGNIPKDREGIGEELNLFSQNALAIRVLWRGDVAVQRPDHFVKITGINTVPVDSVTAEPEAVELST